MGAFLFAMIPIIRRELRVEPRTGVSVLPYETKKTVFTKAKQTIDNRLAGRAAKGAIPVDRTTKIGCPEGHPIFVCYESLM